MEDDKLAVVLIAVLVMFSTCSTDASEHERSGAIVGILEKGPGTRRSASSKFSDPVSPCPTPSEAPETALQAASLAVPEPISGRVGRYTDPDSDASTGLWGAL